MTERRRICFLMRWHPQARMGGAETQAAFIAGEMARRGWDVHYLTGPGGDWTPGERRENGVQVHVLPPGRLERHLPRRALAWLKRLRPAVVYQRMAHELTAAAARYARRRGALFVWAASSPGDCRRHKYREKLAALGGRGPGRRLAAAMRDRLAAYGLRRADVRLVQNEEQRALLADGWGLPAEILPNAHPLPEAQPVKDEPPVVLWLANLKQSKRPGRFLELAAALRGRSDVRFLLVGAGEDELARAVGARAEELGNLEVRRRVDGPTACALAGRASFLVNSSDEEGFPNTFIQAWLRSTVVASFRVDPSGVFSREGLGLLDGTAKGLAEKIADLLDRPRERAALAARALAVARERHALPGHVDRLEAIIERCRP